MNFRVLLKGLLMMAGLLIIGWGWAIGVSGRVNSHWVDTAIRGNGLTGLYYYIGMGSMLTSVGVPRQAICALGGYAFGLGKGLMLAELGSGLGCLFCFLYARLIGRAFVRRRFAGRLEKIDGVLTAQPFTMAMAIRLLPVGNNLLTNLAAGVSSVPLLPFLAGSLIGYLPQTVIFVLLGSGINVQPVWRTVASVVLFILSGLLGGLIYRRVRL